MTGTASATAAGCPAGPPQQTPTSEALHHSQQLRLFSVDDSELSPSLDITLGPKKRTHRLPGGLACAE